MHAWERIVESLPNCVNALFKNRLLAHTAAGLCDRFIAACLCSDDKFIMSVINYGILARCYSVIGRNHLGGGVGGSMDPKGLCSVKILHYPQAQMAVCTVVIMVDNTGTCQ